MFLKNFVVITTVVYCTICSGPFTVSHGWCDISDRLKMNKHKMSREKKLYKEALFSLVHTL